MKKLLIVVFVILLCSGMVYSSGIAASNEVGPLVDISVYVNEIQIDTPVYRNRSQPAIQGPHNVSDYVQLAPVLDVLHLNNTLSKRLRNNEGIVYIDGVAYIPFSTIRYHIGGSLRQDDYSSMYLYSRDFIRTDIPATLEECYAALDILLDEDTKQDIKTSSSDALIGNHHFGLGMWIRNNWIYPATDRIAKVFLDAGIDHPDDMSSIILEGYRSYLNGLAYEITP